MSALIRYENYTQPFMGFGQDPQRSWLRRNWAFLMQVIGLTFVAGGMAAKSYIDRQVPKEQQLSANDWQELLNATQQIYPKMPRAEIERTLCQVFGDRAPYCVGVGAPSMLPPPEPSEGLPSWIWIAALGVGAVLLLK